MNDFDQTSREKAGVESQKGFSKERAKMIAKSQRIVLFFILTYLPIIAVIFVAIFSKPPSSLFFILIIAVLAYSFFSYVHMVLLANWVFGVGMAIFCGIIFWIFPPLGFILLIIVNGRASKLLKNEGYKVGLLGVNPNSIN